MNIEKLRNVKKAILKDPGSQFIMESYFGTVEGINFNFLKDGRELKRRKIHNCGTAACIAGTAIAVELCEGNRARARSMQVVIFEVAREILSLTKAEAQRLFYISWESGPENSTWPASFRYAYRAAKTLKERKRVAARRIEHFIKTNGAE